ncbi:protein BPS1, chloroplastic [Physcomitrium patens]|uniref:Uncharacterized protein n=1 Tax=Physcomitrium patens TaxID=3218 RepID=A0A2K1IIV1_PHYPA|nr:protein BPS1, chloroplastic-like [Physcomitrium patens]PNR29206.1 hypothetical protein PHYPA_027898 [Physcomitrium patens]|eukprot:XP_024362397.1 protein BPS1, chloroplastic-like [Physcomitrella patens]
MTLKEGSSILASLGAVLNFHFSLHRSSHTVSASAEQCPVLHEFETRLKERLDALKPAGEEKGFLSVDWLLQAMSIVLATHANVEVLIPESQLSLSLSRDDKWVDEYLDDSAKLLDVCNVLKEGISEVEHYQMLVQLALHTLDNKEIYGELKHSRARNALAECKEAIVRKDTEYRQGFPKSKLENCSSMLRTIGEKLVNPKGQEAYKGNGFLNAIYGAKVTTIFLCGLLVTALACKPKRPLATLSVASHYKWSPSLISLQQRVKEETDKRKNKGSIALLRELDNVDASVRRLHDVLDQHLSERAFPLSRKQARELAQAVEALRIHSSDLEQGLTPLEAQVNELFRVLIASRLALLDIISSARA